MNERELIAALVADLRPARRLPGLTRSFLEFAGVAAIGVALLTRGGTGLRVADPLSIAALALIAGAAAAAGLVSSVPGRRGWAVAAVVAAAALVAWDVTLGLRVAAMWADPRGLWGAVPWPKCFAFSLVAGAAPAWFLLRRVGLGWMLRPRLSCSLAAGAGITAGALAVALECPSAAPLHVLLGHAMPVLGSAAAAFVALPLACARRRV